MLILYLSSSNLALSAYFYTHTHTQCNTYMYLFSFCAAEFLTVFEDVLTICVLKLWRRQISMKRRRAFSPWREYLPENVLLGRESRYLVWGVSKLQVSVLLGCDFTLLGVWYLTFRDNTVVSSSRLEISMNLFLLLSSLSLFVQSGRVPFVVRGISILPFLCFPDCLFLSCLGPWHGRPSLSPLSILILSLKLFLVFL